MPDVIVAVDSEQKEVLFIEQHRGHGSVWDGQSKSMRHSVLFLFYIELFSELKVF